MRCALRVLGKRDAAAAVPHVKKRAPSRPAVFTARSPGQHRSAPSRRNTATGLILHDFRAGAPQHDPPHRPQPVAQQHRATEGAAPGWEMLGDDQRRRRFPLWLGAEINAKPGATLRDDGQQDVTFTRLPGAPPPGGRDDPPHEQQRRRNSTKRRSSAGVGGESTPTLLCTRDLVGRENPSPV